MLKKIGISKIETEIPYDVFVSSIDGLISNVDRVNLEVYFTSKKIYELEDTMFVLLNMYDNSGEMQCLLVGNRSQEFISLVDNVKYGLRYRVSGNVCTLDNDIEDRKLSFTNEIKNGKVFCLTAIQCYSDTIYGVPYDEFNGCIGVEEEYEIVSKYTTYLNNIELEQVKNIKVDCNYKIAILLHDGTFLINGKVELDNIKETEIFGPDTIIAISNDNVITGFSNKHSSKLTTLNNNDYSYKKVLIGSLGVVALTHEGTIIYFGMRDISIIDPMRFINVNDINYADDHYDEFIVRKDDGTSYSLFDWNMPDNNYGMVNIIGGIDRD